MHRSGGTGTLPRRDASLSWNRPRFPWGDASPQRNRASPSRGDVGPSRDPCPRLCLKNAPPNRFPISRSIFAFIGRTVGTRHFRGSRTQFVLGASNPFSEPRGSPLLPRGSATLVELRIQSLSNNFQSPSSLRKCHTSGATSISVEEWIGVPLDDSNGVLCLIDRPDCGLVLRAGLDPVLPEGAIKFDLLIHWVHSHRSRHADHLAKIRAHATTEGRGRPTERRGWPSPNTPWLHNKDRVDLRVHDGRDRNGLPALRAGHPCPFSPSDADRRRS